MKIVGVIGSPSSDGNTAVLARQVLNGAKAAGAETEELFLAEYRIEYCHGCISRNRTEHCMSTGRCVIDDDAHALREKLYAADGIVLASPTYGLSETARMKNFLTDRIGMYTVYTSGFGGKYFTGVSTCGGVGASKVARSLGSRYTAGFHQRAFMSGYIGVKLDFGRIENKPAEMEKAYNLGKKLAADISSRRKYPIQKLMDRALTALIVRRMILKNIYARRDSTMKSVYQNLVSRKLLPPQAGQ